MVDQTGDVFAKRYGEVLLVHAGEQGPEATVYNTFPLNDCPAALWDASTPMRWPRRTAPSPRCSTVRATG